MSPTGRSARMPELSVSLGLWQDRPSAESLEVAKVADALGYDELWIGEMATYDAFVLATAVGLRTARIPLVVGPLAVSVRDPMMIAMGAASVAELTGRQVDVALGTSSSLVVEQWHGRSRARAATALRDTARALRPLLDGEKPSYQGEVARSTSYRLRAAAPRSTVTVAAFGPHAVRTAAQYADRLVLNLVDAPTAAHLVSLLEDECRRLQRPRPRVALWVAAATSGDAAATQQLRSAVVGYLGADGYAQMFERAGFGDVVRLARSGAHPREVWAAIPDDLLAAVCLLGDAQTRIADYRAAGVDEVVVVPTCTDTDPAARALLTSLAPGQGADPPRSAGQVTAGY